MLLLPILALLCLPAHAVKAFTNKTGATLDLLPLDLEAEEGTIHVTVALPGKDGRVIPYSFSTGALGNPGTIPVPKEATVIIKAEPEPGSDPADLAVSFNIHTQRAWHGHGTLSVPEHHRLVYLGGETRQAEDKATPHRSCSEILVCVPVTQEDDSAGPAHHGLELKAAPAGKVAQELVRPSTDCVIL